MSKLTKASRGKSCTIRVPDYCNGNDETTVLAHLSGVRFGHGVGIKVNDILGADACSCCHDVIDGRTGTPYTRQEIKLMHCEGVMETILRRIAEGVIKL